MIGAEDRLGILEVGFAEIDRCPEEGGRWDALVWTAGALRFTHDAGQIADARRTDLREFEEPGWSHTRIASAMVTSNLGASLRGASRRSIEVG